MYRSEFKMSYKLEAYFAVFQFGSLFWLEMLTSDLVMLITLQKLEPWASKTTWSMIVTVNI